MRRALHIVGPLLAAALAVGAGLAPAGAQDGDVIALVGARWLRAGGEPVDDTTVVVDGGRIRAIGPGVAVPPAARRVDARGGTVTAGLVASLAPLGLEEISLEASTRDAAPEGPADPVRSGFRAVDGYNPRSTAIPVARIEGVTSCVVAPVGGLVSGTAAWIDLEGTPEDPGVVDPASALVVRVDDGGVASAGGARPAAWARLREVFEDAALWARRRGEFEARRLRDLSVSRGDLERLAEAVAGRIPVVLHVSRADDVVRALELGRAFGLRLVLAGVEEGHLVADAIARAGVPVVLEPLTNLPRSFSRLASRYDNAARLHAAGVEELVITTPGPHGLRNLRQEVGNAVASGLPRRVALAAVTSTPARVFGAERHGELAAGGVANLVLWDGYPFEVTTSALRVFVRGREVPLRSRQTALFERYRDLSRVRRAPARPPAPSEPET